MNNSRTSPTLKIAMDASALKSGYRHHGIQVYTKNLLEALRHTATAQDVQIRPFLPAAEDSSLDTFAGTPNFFPRQTSWMTFDRVWRYGGATAAALLDSADVLFNPNGASAAVSSLVPTVTTIHDLTPMVMPCFPRRIAFLLKRLLMRSARLSTAIITVSECSRRDIVRLCGVPPEKVHVIYEGYDRALFNDASPDAVSFANLRGRLGINRPYILHHGAIQPRKNLPRLIAAYLLMLARNRNLDLDLVLAGPLAWQYEETVAAAREDHESRSRVILTGPLNDTDLSVLLRGATLAVIPSLYEGFCLPMIEAMACGVPTIVSRGSCLPEVSGGALRYFDPYSVEAIANCMEEALQSQDLRGELAEHGKERAQQFSWHLCAEETLAVVEQVALAVRGRARAAGVAL